MMLNMYCRPFDLDDELNSGVMLSNHANATPIPAPRHCRRRLEDPVQTQISNYYALYPGEISNLEISPMNKTPIPLPRKIYQKRKTNNNDIQCDLFNLLENVPPIKPRRKYLSPDFRPSRPVRTIDRVNNGESTNDHRRIVNSHHLMSHHEKYDHLTLVNYADQLKETRKLKHCVNQGFLSRRAFFRRVARNYFCIPITISHDDFSI